MTRLTVSGLLLLMLHLERIEGGRLRHARFVRLNE